MASESNLFDSYSVYDSTVQDTTIYDDPISIKANKCFHILEFLTLCTFVILIFVGFMVLVVTEPETYVDIQVGGSITLVGLFVTAIFASLKVLKSQYIECITRCYYIEIRCSKCRCCKCCPCKSRSGNKITSDLTEVSKLMDDL